jgi:hypothetical protein
MISGGGGRARANTTNHDRGANMLAQPNQVHGRDARGAAIGKGFGCQVRDLNAATQRLPDLDETRSDSTAAERSAPGALFRLDTQ